MRSLILAAALCLTAGCATPAASVQSFPTQLPENFIQDDQLGISVELAYQAASLAERTAIKAGFVHGARAVSLIKLDNQAYLGVCAYRTAYDVANGRNPAGRQDGCPSSTKVNRYVSYADAARQAISLIQGLVTSTKQAQQ